MSLIEKLHTLIISIAVLLGLAFGQIGIVEVYAHYFIVPFLLLMLYGLFLGVPVKDLKKAFVDRKFCQPDSAGFATAYLPTAFCRGN